MHYFALTMVNLQSFFLQKAKGILFRFECYEFCIQTCVRSSYSLSSDWILEQIISMEPQWDFQELFKMLKFEIR